MVCKNKSREADFGRGWSVLDVTVSHGYDLNVSQFYRDCVSRLDVTGKRYDKISALKTYDNFAQEAEE